MATFPEFKEKKSVRELFEKKWELWIADVPPSQERKIDINNEMISFIFEKNCALGEEKLENKNSVLLFCDKRDILSNDLS